MAALVPRCLTTEPLPAWEAQILHTFFERFDRSFRRHNAHGRGMRPRLSADIFLPLIKTRTELPGGLTLDNGLGPAMDACKKCVRALCGKSPVLDAKESMLELQGKFEAMRALLLVRLGEEESAGIPLMRKHFTHAEIRPALRKVLAGSRPMDLPQLLRPMAPAERAAWLLLHGVPTLVQALLINPRCRIYDTKFTSPMAALVSGIAPPPHRQAASSLFQCMRPVAVPA